MVLSMDYFDAWRESALCVKIKLGRDFQTIAITFYKT